MKGFVCVFVLVLVFYLLLQFSQSAEITVQPVSINTTLNSTAQFLCEGTGDVLIFLVDSVPANRDVISARGFDDDVSEIGGVSRGVLTATAYDINNNTNVTCLATTLPSTSVTSDTVFLTIQGLLESVVDLDYTFINGSSVLLTWTAPYTLDNVPITGYYIVSGLVNITTTNKSIILSATNPDPCILNNVSVSPINDVGIGSSNNISFYYETVPLITPPVSVVPVIDGQLISLNISINVSALCKGEYPNSITVNILNTDNAVIKNTSIPTQVNDQLMITGVITVPNNLNTFIVNVSLSNNGGDLLPILSFGFGKVGPVTNICSSIDNCSTIDITWTAPTVDDRVSILYYNLSIYDAMTGLFLRSVAVYGTTTHQFEDNDLFRTRYTYVITGVNELGEGISNNNTFSYQRVPRSVEEAVLHIIALNQTSANVSFSIPVIVNCTGEAPGNATVTIECTGIVIFQNTILVEYAPKPIDITGSVPVPLYEQCNITFIVSNDVGSSEPFILTFVATVLPTMSSTSVTSTLLPTVSTRTASLDIIIISAAVGAFVCVVLVVIIIVCYLSLRLHHKKKPRNKRKASESHGLLNERVSFDGSSARGSIGITTGETKLSPSQSTNSNEPPANTTKEAAREPIYSDLAPSTGTTSLAKTEAATVQYADIESVRPKPKGSPVQSYDDVVVSASGTTVIGATGGDPPPIPDKKSKGTATTTGQEGTNGGTDATKNLPHHVNDDSHFSSAPPSRSPPLPPHASIEGRREGRESSVATYL